MDNQRIRNLTHTGETDIAPMDDVEKEAFWKRYAQL